MTARALVEVEPKPHPKVGTVFRFNRYEPVGSFAEYYVYTRAIDSLYPLELRKLGSGHHLSRINVDKRELDLEFTQLSRKEVAQLAMDTLAKSRI